MALGRFQVICSPLSDEGDGAPPQRCALVEEDVGCARGGELGCCHRAHVGAIAGAVGEKEDVGVTAWGKGQRADVVDADSDTGGVRQGQGIGGPADGLVRGHTRLALETAPDPPAGGAVHADPQKQSALEPADRAGNFQVPGSGGVAGVHNPWGHQYRNVRARGW